MQEDKLISWADKVTNMLYDMVDEAYDSETTLPSGSRMPAGWGENWTMPDGEEKVTLHQLLDACGGMDGVQLFLASQLAMDGELKDSRGNRVDVEKLARASVNAPQVGEWLNATLEGPISRLMVSLSPADYTKDDLSYMAERRADLFNEASRRTVENLRLGDPEESEKNVELMLQAISEADRASDRAGIEQVMASAIEASERIGERTRTPMEDPDRGL